MVLLAIAAFRTLTISYTDRWLDCAVLAAVLLTASLTRKLPRPTLAVAGFGGLAAIAAVQFAASATVYRFDTFGAMLFWASLAAACWISPPRHSFNAALAFATAIAVAVLLHPLPELTGPFQSRNNAASFLLLFLPIALYRGFTLRRRALPLAIAALLAAALFASGSRAGAALALLEIGGLLLLVRPPRQVVFATAGVAAAGLLAAGSLLDRFQEAVPLGFRPAILASTVQMILAKPLAGFGLGTFEAVYPAFATFDTGLVVNQAHNDWAQLTAEGGVFAFSCFALLLVCVIRRIRTTPWAIGLLAVLAHALVDYPFARAGVALWFAILLGIASRSEPEFAARDAAP